MCYTSYMERVNIYLPTKLRQQIQLQAQRVHQPQAVVIRDLLERGLQNSPAPDGNVLLRMAAHGFKGGPADLATNIDKYLYEDE
jgi:hypothetical protein